MDNTTTNVQGREIKFRAIVPVNSDEPKTMQYFDLSKIDDCNRLAYADYDIKGLMQFTGLKDKYGKDIYEGDVDSHGRYIEYRDGGFHVVQGNGQTYDYLCHMKHIEIVGNIYEPIQSPPTEGIIAEGLIDHGV